MKRSGQDDFWALSSSSRYLPRETREYVPLILAAIIVAKNPVAVRLRHHRRRADRLREGDRPARHRPAPRRRVDRPQHRRDPGAQPRAAALDDAVKAEYELKVPVGTASALQRASGVGLAERARRADVVHGEEGRVDRDDRAEAAGQPRRSRGGEPPLDQVAASRRARRSSSRARRRRCWPPTAGPPRRPRSPRARSPGRPRCRVDASAAPRRAPEHGRAREPRRLGARPSPTASSAATRSSRSRGCSTRPSPGSRA